MRRFYDKILLNVFILWIIPWAMVVVSFPRTFYASSQSLILTLKFNAPLIVLSMFLAVVVSIVLVHLKRNSKKKYAKFLKAAMIFYLIFIGLLAILMFRGPA